MRLLTSSPTMLGLMNWNWRWTSLFPASPARMRRSAETPLRGVPIHRTTPAPVPSQPPSQMEISTPHPGPLPVRGGEGGGAHHRLVLRAVAEEDVVGEGW